MTANNTDTDREHRILIAGFGGQGILSLGKLLCNAAIAEGLNATYMPSYGTEVRGGTCNCHIVISPEEIFSPYVEAANSLVILNQMSYDRFRGILVPGGNLVYDSSMVAGEEDTSSNKQVVLDVPARDMAAQMGNELVANVILLGGFINLTGLCQINSLETAIEDWLTPDKTDQIDLNLKALHTGLEASKPQKPQD